MDKYNHQETEKKWAKKWVEDKTFTPDLENAKNPYYALFMFPYPSAEGLHIGNFYAFTCTDVMAKYKQLQGFDVFEPIGFDAFGIHSENYALKIQETPRKMLNRTIANFSEQMIDAGLSCDWTRVVDTTTPEYYKWTQWIFTKLFEKGLAYQKEALLNWCPGCKTVLADEQIEGGLCERCKSVPEKKTMRQWFFKITAYAQKLLDGLENMDWSDITKAAQRNWIGRSEGAIVKFSVMSKSETTMQSQNGIAAQPKVARDDITLEIFTTRPDTLFGCTYMVLAPEHPLVKKLTISEQKEAVEEYVKKAGAKSDLERTEEKEKTGVFTGAYAINPVNEEKIPIWVADYVLMGYGTGAIMAVPAHDERDWEFAKKYDLKIIEVVKGGTDVQSEVFVGDGVSTNSEFLNGLSTDEAIKEMIAWLEERGLGKKMINYRLRDWCISRQRYWGPPVPVVYCDHCGTVAVPEDQLPVVLPELKEGWEPAGDGRGPLAKVESFMKVKCPLCGGEASREPDVMDNFLDSAWYYFRYLSPRDNKNIFDKKLGEKWLPVDLYVGGNEHAVLHLMYTRFITMVLHDLGLTDFDNPFKRFRANGMILKDGKKMSKSKGNVVNPEEYGEKVGYDALKTYLLFLGPLSEDRSFTDSGVLGCRRWIEKICRLEEKVDKNYQDDSAILRKLHQTIKILSDDFEEQKYNTSVARLMELTNLLTSVEKISQRTWKIFLALIAPFAPALAEELWQKNGDKNSIFKGKAWPIYDPELAKNDKIELVVQVNGKLRDSIEVDADIAEEDAKKVALESEKIKTWTASKEIVKVVCVKGKLVNIVVR